MKVRIYTNTKTRNNENWNTYGTFQTGQHQKYKDPIITGQSAEMDVIGAKHFQKQFYQKIGIDIVTETVFDYPYPATTEKILRPMLNKRMFLIVGPAYTLRFLKTKGFQTFSPFINEEYDEIRDPIDRMNFLLQEIDRLVTLPIDSIRDAVLNYKSVLDSNFTTVVNLEKLELEDLKDRLSKI